MERFDWVVRKHFYRRWECCGLVWELLLSNRYPWRYNWNPVCPECGKKFVREK